MKLEHQKTAAELDLEDRIFHTTPRDAYITLKDHKPDFQTRPSVRLINPTKPEIGRIAMQILDNLVKEIRSKSDLEQCTNTAEVIEWFELVKQTPNLSFIVFDIETFYPSITPLSGQKNMQMSPPSKKRSFIKQVSLSCFLRVPHGLRKGALILTLEWVHITGHKHVS